MSQWTSYFVVALRNLRKNKVFSVITVFGLAVGLACCLIILQHVRHELSFDRFHENADRIYRLTEERNFSGRISHSAKTNVINFPQVSEKLPEIVETARILPMGCMVETGGKEFSEVPYFSDPSILSLFTFPLTGGDSASVLGDPYSMVISERFARKAFGGTADALGQTLTVNGRHDFRVTGLMNDVPSNSHLRFDILCPFSRLKEMFERERDYNRGYAYLLVSGGSSSAVLEEKINAEGDRILGPRRAAMYDFHLQPLTSIHLHSRLNVEITRNGRPGNLYFLSAIALLVLFLACINFVNLSTARAARRAKEVGVRKSAGASRRNLIAQFLGESVLSACLAAGLAWALAQAVLPLFISLAGQDLPFRLSADPALILLFVLLSLGVGLTAGVYPALILSSFSPQAALKGRGGGGSRGRTGFRKSLLALQFAVTIAFVVASVTTFRQMSFIRGRNLGFASDNVVQMHHTFSGPLGRYPLLRNEILRDPSVIDVTGSDANSPGYYAGFEDTFHVQGQADRPVSLYASQVAENFLSFFDIPLVAGRDFTAADTVNPGSALILNEAAARLLGSDSPVGLRLQSARGDLTGTVIGVAGNYHNVSLYEPIKPAVFICYPWMSYSVYVKFRKGAGPADVKRTARAMESLNPDFPVVSFYLDETIANQYRDDARAFRIFQAAFFLSLLIASLGLLGLVSYSVERRTKEIGIRKVLGASLPRIFRILTAEYAFLVVSASALAWPVSFYLMNRWLRNFAYRVGFGAGVFFIATGLALVAAFLVMAVPAFRVARSNPVDSLRYE